MSYKHHIIDTSYHEAGHVIIAFLNFGMVDFCYVDKNLDTDISGWTEISWFCDFDIDDSVLFNSRVNAEIYSNYAGLCADKHYYTTITGSKKYPKVIKSGSSIDLQEISKIINKFNIVEPGQKRAAFKQKMMRRSAKLINKHWDDVVIVSHALFNKSNNKLYYDDFKSILKKSNNKDLWRTQFKIIDYIYNNDNLTNDELRSLINIKL